MTQEHKRQATKHGATAVDSSVVLMKDGTTLEETMDALDFEDLKAIENRVEKLEERTITVENEKLKIK